MSEELFTTKDTPDWAVYPQGSGTSFCFALRYNGKVHLKRKGEQGRRALQDMADFMNKRGMTPREKVECLADEGLVPLPKKAKPVSCE